MFQDLDFEKRSKSYKYVRKNVPRHRKSRYKGIEVNRQQREGVKEE